MKNILKISTVYLVTIMLMGCGNTTLQKEGHTDKNDTEDTHEETKNTIALQPKQLNVMQIELGTLQSVNLGNTLKVNGQLELPPQKMASVSALLGGSVEKVTVIEGDYVKKGQVIAYLKNPEFIKMQRDYLTSKGNFSFLRKNYQRKKSLFEDGITSAKSFQEAEALFLESKSNLSATKASLKMMGIDISLLENGKIIPTIPVKAPIKGYIQNVEINIGKYISPEQEMFEIVDNEHLHLGLKIFEKDIDKAKVGQKITFSLTTKPNKVYEAEIFALGKAFDMSTRAVKVHAKIIGNHEGLLTGMFVDARIITTTSSVKALPESAFVKENGLDYIFIQKEKNEDTIVLEKIQVNKGISDLGFSEVVFINTIPDNTVIVTKGAYYVNAELNKSEFEEHEH
ncbi:efflux RND transporter periplasmic adaptor subunit [Lutibacter sp.]